MKLSKQSVPEIHVAATLSKQETTTTAIACPISPLFGFDRFFFLFNPRDVNDACTGNPRDSFCRDTRMISAKRLAVPCGLSACDSRLTLPCFPVYFSVCLSMVWPVACQSFCDRLACLLGLCREFKRSPVPCAVPLVGLVVKASVSRAEDPGFQSRLRQEFSGSGHISDFKIGTPVAILPGAWHYRASAWTCRFSVSILWVRWKVGSATSVLVCQTLAVMGSGLGPIGPVSVYFDWVR